MRRGVMKKNAFIHHRGFQQDVIRLSSDNKNTYAQPTFKYFFELDPTTQVPFDPFLPWIFMGEEISMSARLWTAGYDIFSPTINVLNHYYVRRHYPKFWESVNR